MKIVCGFLQYVIWDLWIGIFNLIQTAGIFDLLQTVLTLVSLYFVKRGAEQVIWQTKFEMQVKAITKVRVCVSNVGRVIHYYKGPMEKEYSQYHYDIVYVRDWLSGMDKCIDDVYVKQAITEIRCLWPRHCICDVVDFLSSYNEIQDIVQDIDTSKDDYVEDLSAEAETIILERLMPSYEKVVANKCVEHMEKVIYKHSGEKSNH